MMKVEAVIETKTTIEIDLALAAKWFAQISDDDMSKFFCIVAEEVKAWPNNGNAGMMWCYVGCHLAECECSTEDGREMIRSIAYHMEHSLANPLPPRNPGDQGEK